jgi:hypothetical protein
VTVFPPPILLIVSRVLFMTMCDSPPSPLLSSVFMKIIQRRRKLPWVTQIQDTANSRSQRECKQTLFDRLAVMIKHKSQKQNKQKITNLRSTTKDNDSKLDKQKLLMKKNQLNPLRAQEEDDNFMLKSNSWWQISFDVMPTGDDLDKEHVVLILLNQWLVSSLFIITLSAWLFLRHSRLNDSVMFVLKSAIHRPISSPLEREASPSNEFSHLILSLGSNCVSEETSLHLRGKRGGGSWLSFMLWWRESSVLLDMKEERDERHQWDTNVNKCHLEWRQMSWDERRWWFRGKTREKRTWEMKRGFPLSKHSRDTRLAIDVVIEKRRRRREMNTWVYVWMLLEFMLGIFSPSLFCYGITVQSSFHVFTIHRIVFYVRGRDEDPVLLFLVSTDFIARVLCVLNVVFEEATDSLVFSMSVLRIFVSVFLCLTACDAAVYSCDDSQCVTLCSLPGFPFTLLCFLPIILWCNYDRTVLFSPHGSWSLRSFSGSLLTENQSAKGSHMQSILSK